MTRRNSFLVPPKQSITAHTRRRSADDRSGPSNFTPITPSRLGRSQSRPLCISSSEEDDENDEDYEHSDLDCIDGEPQVPKRSGIASSPRSKPEKASRSRLLATPTNTRPVPRQAVTAPEARRKPDLEESLVESSPSRQTYSPPCGGHKPFVYLARYFQHTSQCTSCQTALRNETREKKNLAHNVGQSADKNLFVERARESGITPKDDNGRYNHVAENDQQKPRESQGRPKEEKRSPMKDKDVIEVSRKQNSAQDIHIDLIGIICRDLTAKEQGGFVYLVRCLDANKEGLVKIGFTTNFSQRMANFKTRCRLDMRTIRTWNYIESIKRVETLAKVDLSHLREVWACRCGQNHGEWFRVDEDFAVETVDMWVKWMEQEPYTASELKPLWQKLVKKGRTPAKTFEHHDHDAKHVHWRTALTKPTREEEERFGEKEMALVQLKKPDDCNQEVASCLGLKGIVKALGPLIPSDHKAQKHMNINISISNRTITTKTVVKHG